MVGRRPDQMDHDLFSRGIISASCYHFAGALACTPFSSKASGVGIAYGLGSPSLEYQDYGGVVEAPTGCTLADTAHENEYEQVENTNIVSAAVNQTLRCT